MGRMWLAVFALLSLSFVAAEELEKIPVWIDTDPAVGQKNRDVDDGLALLQAFHSPELEIVGISAVFGNAALDYTFPNAKEIARRFGPPGVSVYRGAASAEQLNEPTPASKALAAALEKRKLSILAIGPASNVAAVISTHPQLVGQIKEIVLVAGRRPNQRFQTGEKNRKAHRDFNFELDPKAFGILLESSVPLVLAPFEISSKVWIQDADLERLARGTEATRWLAEPARRWLGLWKEVFAVNGFNPFDTLAVAYLTTPDLVTWEELPAEIHILPDDVTEERMQGTHVDEKPYLLVSDKFSSQRRVRYCYDVASEFKEELLQRLLRRDSSDK